MKIIINLLSKSTNNIQENNFKLLLEQNYLNYTLSLKKLYPILNLIIILN